MIYPQPTPQFKPLIEVAAMFIDDNDHILLLHRQKNKSQGNKWGIPGGKIEKGETALEAAIRETKEETGFDVSDQTIENLGAVYIEYDEINHFVYHMFRTKLKSDPWAVQINFEAHKGFTWVTPCDALKMDLLQDEDPCIRMIYQL